MSNYKKIAEKVARRVFKSYTPKGDLEKVVGEILTQSLGIDDASKEYFDKVEKRVEETLDEAGLDLDVDNPKVYPYIRRAVNEVADEMNMIK